MTSALENLYPEHLSQVLIDTRGILTKFGYARLVIHSGTRISYALDDQHAPFKTFPHFTRFAPVTTPGALIEISAHSVRVIEVVPDDYWEDHTRESEFWANSVEYVEAKTSSEAFSLVAKSEAVFIGDEVAQREAKKYGFSEDSINDERILEELSRSREIKTEYEVVCIREANARTSAGFAAVSDAFMAGASEFELHLAYLKAVSASESELPYPTIVALNEKASVLHYQRKRGLRNGKVLLLDAGFQSHGYASDVTRTYQNGAHELFNRLLTGLDALQTRLASSVKPGVPFVELHHEAHIQIAQLLREVGLITEDALPSVELGITRAFFPHGLGHMLGIQVHDVVSSRDTALKHKYEDLYPKLRAQVVLEKGMVTTIEPGIYFIPMLLNGLSERAKEGIHWSLVEQLTPFGGIRIEDDVLVTESGSENLTRQFIP